MEKLVREKLLPLLDKFEEERAEKIGKSEARNNIKYNPRVWSVNDVLIYEKYKVYSKEYGFIKWLVENDKIDIDKYYEFMTNENIDISNACGELDMDKEFYYEFLMILAVQDNSIEFLISILK